MKTIMNKHNSRLKGFLMFISFLGFWIGCSFLMWNSSEPEELNLTSSANDPSTSLVRSKQETPYVLVKKREKII